MFIYTQVTELQSELDIIKRQESDDISLEISTATETTFSNQVALSMALPSLLSHVTVPIFYSERFILISNQYSVPWSV